MSFVPEALPGLSPVQVYDIEIYDVILEILSIGPRLNIGHECVLLYSHTISVYEWSLWLEKWIRGVEHSLLCRGPWLDS